MSKKIKIEINETTYNNLKKQLEEGKKTNSTIFPFDDVDQYIENILATFSISADQLKGMESKMSDLLDMFGSEIGDIDLSSIFSKRKEKPKKDEPSKQTTKNYKN